MNLLNNPWMVGIGGGILSGFIVMAASRFLLSKRDNREYIQKVSSANRELIYSIRPGISEGVIPSPDVVESLAIATARKFGVERRDLYGPHELAQELLKEVMDSSFISAKTKEDYCTKLSGLAERPRAVGVPAEISEKVKTAEGALSKSIAEYRHSIITMVSIMMGAMAAVMTGLFSTFSKIETKDFVGGGPLIAAELELLKRVPILLPTILSVATVAFTMWLLIIYRDLAHKRASRTKETENECTEKAVAPPSQSVDNNP